MIERVKQNYKIRRMNSEISEIIDGAYETFNRNFFYSEGEEFDEKTKKAKKNYQIEFNNKKIEMENKGFVIGNSLDNLSEEIFYLHAFGTKIEFGKFKKNKLNEIRKLN